MFFSLCFFLLLLCRLLLFFILFPLSQTPRDPTPLDSTGQRNSTAESVGGTCVVVALAPQTLGLLTIVPITATHHHLRPSNAASTSNTSSNNTTAGTPIPPPPPHMDTNDVGAVEWSSHFEPPRIVSEFKLDGALRHAEIHPSQEYLVVLTSKGTLLIYHLWLGQLRGIIPTISSSVHRQLSDSSTTRANTFTMDPSGLYVAIVVPFYERPTVAAAAALSVSTAETGAGGGGGGGTADGTETAAADDNVQEIMAQGNVIVFYEILTGAYAGRIHRRWMVGAVQDVAWSPCGARVAVATNVDHCASVYRLQHGMWDNVRAALAATSSNPEFWTQHPIYLEPFRPNGDDDDEDQLLDDSEEEDEEERRWREGKGGKEWEKRSGRLSRDVSIASMSDALDAIIGSGEEEEASEMLRTDRTGLATARKRLSAMVVAQSIRQARFKIMKKILLPADPETSR